MMGEQKPDLLLMWNSPFRILRASLIIVTLFYIGCDKTGTWNRQPFAHGSNALAGRFLRAVHLGEDFICDISRHFARHLLHQAKNGALSKSSDPGNYLVCGASPAVDQNEALISGIRDSPSLFWSKLIKAWGMAGLTWGCIPCSGVV